MGGMEGVEIFSKVQILSQIDRVMLFLKKDDVLFAELGMHGVIIDCVMDLDGIVKVGCKFISAILKYQGKELTQDLYDLSLPWLHMYF